VNTSFSRIDVTITTTSSSASGVECLKGKLSTSSGVSNFSADNPLETEMDSRRTINGPQKGDA